MASIKFGPCTQCTLLLNLTRLSVMAGTAQRISTAMWVAHCKGHILRQVVKVHPIAMLLGGSQTLCCHLNCTLVPQLVPMTGKEKNKRNCQGPAKPGQLVGVAT